MDIKLVVITTFALALSTNTNASTIVINEFLPNAIGADGGNEWIEFFNNSSSTIDVSGWSIEKATSSYTTFFIFPDGTSILEGEYLVVGGANVIDADLNTSQLGLGNAASSGDALRLADTLNNVIDTVIYGPNNNDGFFDDLNNVALSFAPAPNAGQSLGRFLNGVDTGNSGNDFIAFDNSSFGRSNNISTVPVPASAWLFASGLIGIAGIAKRKKNM